MNKIDHQYYINRCLELAKKNVSSGDGGPFAAVIVRDGQIISEACNSVLNDKDPSAHAEVNAIRKACQKVGDYHLHGCTIYSSCEPCPMCLGAIYWSRAEAIYFAATRKEAANAGFNDNFIYKELDKKKSKRSITTRRIKVEGAIEPFQAWLEKVDREDY
jgi:guanine deaminase